MLYYSIALWNQWKYLMNTDDSSAYLNNNSFFDRSKNFKINKCVVQDDRFSQTVHTLQTLKFNACVNHKLCFLKCFCTFEVINNIQLQIPRE